jgi:hypothetical protein
MGGMDYFVGTLYPQYLDLPSPMGGQKCTNSGCHGMGSFSGGFGLDTNDPTSAGNYRVAQGELMPGGCQMPAANLLVTRPLNLDGAHGGGTLFTTSDPQYQTYMGWFQ